MKMLQSAKDLRVLLPVCLLSALACSGCQTTIGGQTLPSPNYLKDDVQYFPAGPEFQLPNQVRAIREYEASLGEGTDATSASPIR